MILNCWRRFDWASVIRHALVVLVAVTASSVPAMAAPGCATWEVARQQREEGPMWTASICAAAEPRPFEQSSNYNLDKGATIPRGMARPALLELVCFGRDLNLRFSPVIANDADYANARMAFKVTADGAQHRLRLDFEGMDGAFTTRLPFHHPLFEAMMRGNRVKIAETRAQIAPVSFSLAGSRRAITRLIDQCRP